MKLENLLTMTEICVRGNGGGGGGGGDGFQTYHTQNRMEHQLEIAAKALIRSFFIVYIAIWLE